MECVSGFWQDQSGSAFFTVVMMVLVVGQLTLLCVWGTLVEGTFWLRLPWTMLMLVVSCAALAIGAKISEGQVSSSEVMGLGLVWFYAFLVSYIPLKIAAWLFGWRIVQEGSRDESSNRFAIRDMMVGTAVLAVTLAIGRLLLSGDNFPTWSRMLQESGLDDRQMLIGLFIFTI